MPKTENSKAAQWAAAIKSGLSPTLNFLSEPPAEADLATLLSVRELFLIPDHLEFPNLDAARATADKLCSTNRKILIEDLVLECLTAISKRINELCKSGLKDARIIPSAAFTDLRCLSYQAAGFSGPHEQPLYCGLLNSIQPGWEPGRMHPSF
jgi:hypothetical protein